MLLQPGNGIPVTLSSILEEEECSIIKEIEICSCGTDPQDKFRKGLFVCLEEKASDAEEAIERALISGASAAVVRAGLTKEFELFVNQDFIYEVKDPKLVYGRACQALLGNPAEKLKLVAVTGTSGKTSLSYVLAGVLAASGNPVGLIGSLGSYDGKTLIPNHETTPGPDTLASLMAKMVRNNCTHAIIEVSSHALEQEKIAGISFDAICLTNIRRDHIDYHGTIENYRRTKMKIFDYAKKDAIVICNVDDRVSEAILPLIKNPTMTVGMHPANCLVSGMPIEQDKTCQTFYLVAGIDAVPVRTKIIGCEHIYNCLTAAALGVSWNFNLKDIVRGIERVEYVPNRLERIDCGQPFAVFLDNSNTPETLSKSLETLRSVTTGKIYCLMGLPHDDERSKRGALGRVLDTMADAVIITNGNLRLGSDSEAIANDIVSGIKDRKKFKSISKRKEALIWTLSDAQPDDTVLIVSGSASSEAKSTKEQSLDRQFIRDYLYENQASLEPFWF